MAAPIAPLGPLKIAAGPSLELLSRVYWASFKLVSTFLRLLCSLSSMSLRLHGRLLALLDTRTSISL